MSNIDRSAPLAPAVGAQVERGVRRLVENEMDYEAKIGDVVWFRMARMYGTPPVAPVRAMVTKVRDRGCVDLEIGCEDASEVSGTAGMVQHKSSLLDSQIHSGGCWWHGDLPDLRDA